MKRIRLSQILVVHSKFCGDFFQILRCSRLFNSVDVTPHRILCWWCHTHLSRLLEPDLSLWVRQVPFSIFLNNWSLSYDFVTHYVRILLGEKFCFWKRMGHSLPSFLFVPVSVWNGCDVPIKGYVKMMWQRRAASVERLYSLDNPKLIKVLYSNS